MMDLEFEKRLHSAAQELEYPTTPDIAGLVVTRLRPSNRPRFATRKLAWSLTVMLVLVSSLMLIPTARAAIIEFIQIGIVRIFPQPTESPADVIRTATPEAIPPSTATPVIDFPSLIPMLDNIAGETKLANAQETAPYPILLPTYPADLGGPNHVYVQDVEGVMTILVWTDPQQPEHVTMSLHFIPAGHWAITKTEPTLLQVTEVNGQNAVWAEGPYPLTLRNGEIQLTRLIDGHVLIWAQGDITYRLETDLSLEEAIMVAESLQPIP
ncbi:MAG TPA: hypothetical protein VK851_10090 [Anaerolineales bacterium]|nr:hypothetical protein [Anaerolineales bacterium]